ncbi:MAG: transcriptional regulator [Chthoniobacterales bacterium]
MPSRVEETSVQKLGPFEEEIIGIFVQIAQMLSLPRSLGEIYGMLFLSKESLTLDDLVQRLQISKGSASQGLRQLKTIGAVRTHYKTGDRREHFTAEMELRKIAAGFLKEHVEPHIQNTQLRLDALSVELNNSPTMPAFEFLRDRMDRLEGWHRHGRDILPLMSTFLKP